MQLLRGSAGATPAAGIVRSLQRQFGNAYTTGIVTTALGAEREVVPRDVETRILAARGGGQRLDPDVRREMEGRFGHDFADVRVHDDPAAHDASRSVRARAFTLGRDVFFDRGAYDARSGSGRQLLAHELTHVVQNAGRAVQTPLTLSLPGEPAEVEAERVARDGEAPVADTGSAGVVHAKCACGGGTPGEECDRCRDARLSRAAVHRAAAGVQRTEAPPFLIEPTWSEIRRVYFTELSRRQFEKIATPLVLALQFHPRPYWYIDTFLDAIGSRNEDELAAEFVNRITAGAREDQLERMAASPGGRSTLTKLYVAMITGDVTEFQRTQANKVLLTKLRRLDPEDYIRARSQNAKGRPTRIFPVRYMSLTPWREEAPPEATLERTADGTQRVRVTYPVRVRSDRMFAAEWRTIPGVFSGGEVMNPNEIVGIKDYEADDEKVQYLPALAMIDYANRASQSTLGKIGDVIMFAATFGTSGAVAGASRAGKVLLWADRIADVIQVASIFVGENKKWIVKTFPNAGPKLVRAVEIADSVAAIYGVARLAHAGYTIVKDLRQASRAVREEAAQLGRELGENEARVLKQLDEKTDALAKDMEAHQPRKARAEEPAIPKADAPPTKEVPASATKADGEAPKAPGKKGTPIDEIEAQAARTGIPTLKEEVTELRAKAAKPENIREPPDPHYDAELDAGGHSFVRHEEWRTWCRHSPDPPTCGLRFGDQVDDMVDEGLEIGDVERSRRELQERFGPGGKDTPWDVAVERGDRNAPWARRVDQLETNRQFGGANEALTREALSKNLNIPESALVSQVEIRPYLDRAKTKLAKNSFIVDHLATTGDKRYFGFEDKLTPRAPLTPNQTAGYPLFQRNGGVVVGKHAHAFPDGLPPTPVARVMPAVDLKKVSSLGGKPIPLVFTTIPRRKRPRRKKR